MLTVDFDRWGAHAGERLLDIGCGNGRHTFEALRRGLEVVSCDLDARCVGDTSVLAAAMILEGEAPSEVFTAGIRGDVTRLPFADDSFEKIIASEVLEHVPADDVAFREIERVLRPGGSVAVTVPRWWPERVCWALSDEYHDKRGGHVRIYKAPEVLRKLRGAGFEPRESHFAHALHSPYWWLKCAFGPDNERALLPRLYHRFLVWDITKRPRATRALERVLDPVLGKSLVVYATKTARRRIAA